MSRRERFIRPTDDELRRLEEAKSHRKPQCADRKNSSNATQRHVGSDSGQVMRREYPRTLDYRSGTWDDKTNRHSAA